MALAGKSLSLSFSPATQEDEDTLASYLPDADEGAELDPGELPDTLPGHLINLKARFSIGSETVASPEQELAMGSGLASEMGYWQPGRGWDTSENKPIAGEFRALALDLQGISGPAAEKLQTDLETTQAKLEAEDHNGLTKQQLVGNMLYNTILSYFALNDLQDRISEGQDFCVGYRSPSYGLFETNLQPRYWFGVPRQVALSSFAMDVDSVVGIKVHKDNDHDEWVKINKIQGVRLSAMEHAIPEKIFGTANVDVYGVSAIKALQEAVNEGQKIWVVDRGDLGVFLGNNELSGDIEEDIGSAVLSGKVVKIHGKPIEKNGFGFVGYIVEYPDTGSGAYMIGSGEDGSFILVSGFPRSIHPITKMSSIGRTLQRL